MSGIIRSLVLSILCIPALLGMNTQYCQRRLQRQLSQSIILASYTGNCETLKSLLIKKLVLGSSESLLDNALHYAIQSGSGQCVHELLKSGASISTTDSLGWTPLYQATHKGHEECVQVLIQRGALRLLSPLQVKSLLPLAASSGHIGCLKEIIQYAFYIFRPSLEEVFQSMNRIREALLIFKHLQLTKYTHLGLHSQVHILLSEQDTADDVACILLYQLQHNKPIKSLLLGQAFEATVDYLLRSVAGLFGEYQERHQQHTLHTFYDSQATQLSLSDDVNDEVDMVLDPEKVNDIFGECILHGLQEKYNKPTKSCSLVQKATSQDATCSNSRKKRARLDTM